MYDLSIIIVSWNAKNFLLQCLNSLRAQQSSLSLEIIVVDNASEDGSAEAVENDYPEVRLIKNDQNLGFAKANNIGIRRSQGRYLCLINSDVKLLGDCLLKLYQYIEKDPSIGILAPRILNSDLSVQCTCRRFPSLWNNLCFALGLNRIFPGSKVVSSEQMFYFKHDVVKDVEVVSGCFMVVRRKAFEQVGYLDHQFFIYAEDVDWCKRFWEANWRVVFFPGAEAIHYGGASSANAPVRFSAAQEKARAQYWVKHHGPLSVFVFYFIVIAKHGIRILAECVKLVFKPSLRNMNKDLLHKHASCLRALFRT
jgi:GT2 family glycosyltransferase